MELILFPIKLMKCFHSTSVPSQSAKPQVVRRPRALSVLFIVSDLNMDTNDSVNVWEDCSSNEKLEELLRYNQITINHDFNP